MRSLLPRSRDGPVSDRVTKRPASPHPDPLPARGEGERLSAFLRASRHDIALRTLTLHMLEHLAPRLFAANKLAEVQRLALDECQLVDCVFGASIDAPRLQAGIDAWYCRHLKGLPHDAPDPKKLEAALQWLVDDEQLIYAWLIGEQAARCGLDVRVPIKPRPFRETSRLHDAYWLTHLVMLDTDYFARPITSPNATEWGDALTELIPWLTEHPNDDLAGEVAFCLRFLGRDARVVLELLERAAPTEDLHAQATVLLALSAE
jgi:D-amino peptidase